MAEASSPTLAPEPLVGSTSTNAQLDHHSQRALKEVDLALTASTMMAAKAHFALASMHMQKAREMGGRQIRPALVM